MPRCLARITRDGLPPRRCRSIPPKGSRWVMRSLRFVAPNREVDMPAGIHASFKAPRSSSKPRWTLSRC